MTHQEIKELAGNRAVSPWIMKLVNDAVAIEREACADLAETYFDPMWQEQDEAAKIIGDAIRARGQA